MSSASSLEPSRFLYLNSANLSLCHSRVLNAINRHQAAFEKNPTLGLKEAWGKLWKVQNRLATFLGASPCDLILRPNVTDCLNTLILGLPCKPQEEILVGELEYGAIANLCRFKALKDNLKLRVLKLPQSPLVLARLSADQMVDHLVSQISPHTRMIVISHVVAQLGLKIPIERLGAVTRRLGVLLVVDGAYGPGAFPVDLHSLTPYVDFYGASLYKWMMGPKGTAFGWVHPDLQERLVPIQAGWTTFESSGVFSEFGGGHRFQERFKLFGCRDFAPFFAIEELLDFWIETGPETLYRKLWALNASLQHTLRDELGWKLLQPSDLSLRVPMTVFRFPQSLQPLGQTLSDRILRELHLQLHTTELSSGWYGILSVQSNQSESDLPLAVSRLKGWAPMAKS